LSLEAWRCPVQYNFDRSRRTAGSRHFRCVDEKSAVPEIDERTAIVVKSRTSRLGWPINVPAASNGSVQPTRQLLHDFVGGLTPSTTTAERTSLHGRPVPALEGEEDRPLVPVYLLPEGARVATK